MDFKKKLYISLRSVASILTLTRYGALAALFTLFFFLLLRYFFGIQVLATILMSSSIDWLEKISFIVLGFIPSSFAEVLIFLQDPVGLSLFAVALLQGIAVSLIFYLRNLSKRRSGSAKLAGGFTASLISSGCIACGGSIIYPLLASFSTQAALGLSHLVGIFAALISIGLLSHAIYTLGLRISQLKLSVPS